MAVKSGEVPDVWGGIEDDALGREYLEQQARYSRDVPFPAFIHAAVIASMAALSGLPWYLWGGWLGLEVLQRVSRYFVYGRLPTMEHLPMTARLRMVMASSTLSGLIWGGSLFFFPYFSDIERMIQAVILVGMCTASVASTLGYRPVFLAYVIPILLPLTVVWLLVGGFVPLTVFWAIGEGFDGPYWQKVLLALAFAVYVMLMFAMARNSFRVFKESFYMRYEYAELNGRLAVALEDAEASSRAKTRFLASASHDLRQPIHTLSLFCAALSMRDLDGKTRMIADNLEEALESLGSQLDTLLDISKLDAGVVVVKYGTVALKPLLTRLQTEFLPLANDKSLELQMHCDESIHVKTDATLLERIVRNLLSNAIKYTGEGRVDIRVVDEGGKCCLVVRDTGRGIPENQTQQIFEEFYQLENPERDRSKGLGLGLAIVKRLADLLEIRFELDSKPGRGTSFSLLLEPAISEGLGVRPDNEMTPTPFVGQKLQALVVDDEAAVRVGMQTLLEGMGYEVQVTDSTDGAVAMAAVKTPDILLADFRLRGNDDGLQTIRKIREIRPDTPALLISGDTDPQRIREAHDNGVRLLHKPVRGSDLRSAVIEAVQGRNR